MIRVLIDGWSWSCGAICHTLNIWTVHIDHHDHDHDDISNRNGTDEDDGEGTSESILENVLGQKDVDVRKLLRCNVIFFGETRTSGAECDKYIRILKYRVFF